MMIDRKALTVRPTRFPAGFQEWRSLLFVHWKVPVDLLQPLLPPELTVDTFDGEAWVGLIPFSMKNVRPWWCCSIPGISNFHETNLRTYVHFRGESPGVWFFSLDAAHRLAVAAARWGWSLPYYYASMQVVLNENQISYESHRPGTPSARVKIEAEIGPALFDQQFGATDGTLEHFLAERYLLYTVRNRNLLSGQVHHTPYPLQQARWSFLEESVSKAAAVSIDHPPDHVMYSPGVRVTVFPLQSVRKPL